MTANSQPTTSTPLRALGAAMVITLLGQLLLGMANTFWLTVPESGSGWSEAAPMGLLMAHLTLGVALLVFAVWIAVAAFRAHDRTWLIASALGVLGILVAVGAGSAFMGETSSDSSSFLMTVGTVLALGGYAFGLYRLPAATR
jgi:hypothetical protein